MSLARKPPPDERRFLGDRPAPVPAAGLVPFARSRHALEAGLAALGLGAGSRVLLPDFTCDTLLHPLQRLGLLPAFYPLDEALAPEWDALERLAAQASAAVLVHTFGQPQDAARFAEVCRRHGLRFVEDNAHGWGAVEGGRLVGTRGDLGLVSPWKQFPVPHGAFLLVGDGEVRLRVASAARALAPEPVTARRLGRLKALARRIGPLRRALKDPPEYGRQEAFPEPVRQAAAMGASVAAALAKVDLEVARRVRLATYAAWSEWARSRGLAPVFSALAPGAMPLCFPAYVRDPARRERWFAWGWRHDVDVHSWPTLPAPPSPGALERWERLVCFPIHQEMDPDRVRRLLARWPTP